MKNSTYKKYLLNIMLLYQQRRDLKAYLELLLSVAAIALFLVFAIKPTLVTITDLLTKINAEQQTSDTLDTKIKNLGIAQTNFNNNTDKLTLLSAAVPDRPDVANYVRQIEGLIQKESLTVISIEAANVNLTNATSSATTVVTNSLPLTITVTGEFTNLENFIKDIENLRRPAIINKADLVQTDTGLALTIMPKAAYQQ